MRGLVASLLLAASSAAPPPARFSTFPPGTPSTTFPDGPFLGNGATGVVVGGAPGTITLYFALSGFWSSGYGHNSSMPPLAEGPLSFPGCPSNNCSITVGLTLATVTLQSEALAAKGASWAATLDLAGARADVALAAPGGFALNLTCFVSATTLLTVVEVQNVGTAPLPINFTLAANGNMLNVPIASGCLDAAGGPAACPAPGGAALPGAWVTKDANPPGAQVAIPITAALTARTLRSAGLSAASTSPYAATVPHTPWTGGPAVATATTGTATALTIAPGGGFTRALCAAASRDPGVAPASPLQFALAKVAAVAAADLPQLAAAHRAWWAAFFARSSVTLDPAASATEAFWWTSVYAMGAGSRAGGVVMDLWSPWRTTDYSAWRSNPTMDCACCWCFVRGDCRVNPPPPPLPRLPPQTTSRRCTAAWWP